MDYDAIILGGGLTGLYTGYELTKKGKKILIVEKSKDLGGLLGSIKTKGDMLEKYYHHVFVTDKLFPELVEELGLKNNFTWNESTLGFYNKGKIYDMSTPLKYPWFKPLNLIEKGRLGFLILKMKLTKNLEKLDGISAKDWIIKNSGKDVYKKFFKPMLKSKYGDNLDKISASWFIERINLRTTGGLKKEKLGYISGGFNLLIKKLEGKIIENGGKIIKNKSPQKMIIEKNEVKGIIIDKKKIKSKYVISTIPLPSLTEYKELPKEFRKKISSIEYQGAVCLIIGLDKKVTDFYWTNIIDDSIIGALIEHTNFQPLKNYKDHIIYLASYPNFSSDVWKLSEKKVFEKYFNALTKLFPRIKRKDVKWWKLSRDKNAGLVYELGYQKKRIGNKTPIKRLIIGGMFNNYPERSIEGSLKAGEDILKLIKN